MAMRERGHRSALGEAWLAVRNTCGPRPRATTLKISAE
jgi:hypothetical protein